MKKRSRELKPKPETLILDAVVPGPALIKYLASCSAPVRSKALRLLEGWLETQSEVSDDDMKKFWKGLFYCLWHSDKAPLKRILSPAQLRSKFIRAIFDLCNKYSWDLELLGRVVDTFINNAFLAEDKLLGNGVCYHIASVWLDELNGCSVPVDQEVVGLLFKPLFEVMGKCEDRVMVGKVKSCVFDELLNMGKSLLERNRKGVEGKESYAEVALGLIAMKMGFSRMLFEVGSSAECVQGNRKVLFKLHDEFLKLEKNFETEGVDIVLPEVTVEDEEMPELVPIENGKTEEDAAAESYDDIQEDEGHTDEALRKCKKAKTMQDGSNKKGKKEKKKKGVSQDDSANENCVPNGEVAPKELENSKRGKKKKKSEPSENGSAVENIRKDEVENMILADGNSSSSGPDSESKVTFNESVISNLQMQFEKVAAEVDSGSDDDDGDDTPVISMKKKRKRAKSASCIPDIDNAGDSAVSATKSAEKSSKKVRFAMKNNLVWKPHSPMPPQSLRLPPSLTPRGSALKKGVPPGPVREMPPATKRMKQKKKGRKILRTISPAEHKQKQDGEGGAAAEGSAEMIDEDELEMMKKLGIPVGFDSTKGKPVAGNDVGAVRKVTKRQPRQYMNRRGGFNRPLPAEINR
nr:ribosomal RNA processing protein 1 homolog [Ipomoea batatas]